jgi:hypothetical protein
VFAAFESLGIDTSFDPVANAFGNCFNDSPNPLCNLPNVSGTQQGNVLGLYGSLIGRVTSYSNSVAFNPVNKTYSALANTLNKQTGRVVDRVW